MDIKPFNRHLLRIVAIMVMGFCAVGTAWAQNITFDFEDESAHRTSGSNSYTGTNTYTENGVIISLTYADAVQGTALGGSYNVVGRIKKSEKNSPVITIGPITNMGYKITNISFKTRGMTAMDMVVAYLKNNSKWTNLTKITGMPTSPTEKTINSLNLIENELYIRFTVSVSSSVENNRDFLLDDIVITRERLTESVSIGSTGYATFSSTHALDFTDVTDVRAYIATPDGTTGVNFTRVYKVPANTGLLLVSASGGAVDATAVPYLTDEADDVKDNVFVAVNEDTNVSTTADGKNNYILNVGSHGIGFYQAAGNKVGAGKAYISVPTSATVKGFITLPDNDDETGISTVKTTMGNDIIYNLAGLRLGHSPWRRGVLIQNGKKFIVK